MALDAAVVLGIVGVIIYLTISLLIRGLDGPRVLATWGGGEPSLVKAFGPCTCQLEALTALVRAVVPPVRPDESADPTAGGQGIR